MELEKNKLYIIGFVLISMVALYYLHIYQTTRLIRRELSKMAKEKKKKQMKQMMRRQIVDEQQQHQQQQQRHYISEEDPQEEMDSYIDPGNENNDEIDEQPSSNQSMGSSRLSDKNVLMRDMMDGSHQ